MVDWNSLPSDWVSRYRSLKTAMEQLPSQKTPVKSALWP